MQELSRTRNGTENTVTTMNTDTKHQIETALRAFSNADLRAGAIGLLNTLGYQSKKTLDLDNTPDAFLAEFDKRDRKFRKDKALFERWKTVEFLFHRLFQVSLSLRLPGAPFFGPPPTFRHTPADLTPRFGRGFSRQKIQQMRLFYLFYPAEQIRQTLSGELGQPQGQPNCRTASG